MNDEIAYMSATELSAAYRSRSLSPVEVVDSLLDRIDTVDPALHAFITIAHEYARVAARAAEQQIMSTPPEQLGRLCGIPVTVKDLTPTAGVRTTFGLVEELNNVPVEDGLTWSRLKAEGAVLLGKTSTPPLGALCVTENDIVGRTNNPWDPSRSVGGSSGGAAVALATGLGPLAIGSDGGGSIRVPASYCGVMGLKGSRGRIPLYTEGPIFETVDVVGPMTRTVDDCALMLSVMAGPHPRDPYSLLESGVDYLALLDGASLSGVRVAFCAELGRGPIEADVSSIFSSTASWFDTSLGAHVDLVEMVMPDFYDYFMAYWAPYFALFMSDSPKYDFSRYLPLMEWLEIGSKVSAVEHLATALLRREEMHESFASVFDDHDLIITPTTPQAAFPHPEPEFLGPTHVAGVEVALPACDYSRFTDPPSNVGLPAMAVPCGFTPDGLPVSIQIIGRHGADAEVLRAAAAFERSLPGPARRPTVGV